MQQCFQAGRTQPAHLNKEREIDIVALRRCAVRLLVAPAGLNVDTLHFNKAALSSDKTSADVQLGYLTSTLGAPW
jgi:hypothetical protein